MSEEIVVVFVLVGNLCWKVVFFIFLVMMINYVDCQMFLVVVLVIIEEFGFSVQQYGNVVLVFLFVYVIMQVVLGWLIDCIGVWCGFLIVIVWWLIVNMLYVFLVGVCSLMGFCVLFGIGEVVNYLVVVKVIVKWFFKLECFMVVGIFNVGLGFGLLIVLFFIVWLIFQYGWWGVFIIIGVIGFFWFFVWLCVYYDFELYLCVLFVECDYIFSGQDLVSSQSLLFWLELLCYCEVWGVVLVCFIGDGVFYFIVFWLLKYFFDECGFSIVQIGLFVWIFFLVLDIGLFYGGWQGKCWIDCGCMVN